MDYEIHQTALQGGNGVDRYVRRAVVNIIAVAVIWLLFRGLIHAHPYAWFALVVSYPFITAYGSRILKHYREKEFGRL